MNIPGFMKYTRDPGSQEAPALSRIEFLPEMNLGQLRSLPLGTEICIITVGFMGTGLVFKRGIITEEWIAGLEEAALSDGAGDDTEIPGSVFMYLLPEGYEPSMEDLLNEHFIRLGLRHGKEGAPMTSVSQLRERNEDKWHDDAYAAYTTAYKRGAEMRRKGR